MDCSAGEIPVRTGTGSIEESQTTSPHHNTSLEHQRKRLSFFRSSSDASSIHRRAPSSLNVTMTPPHKGRSEEPSRPSTAQSKSRRKTNDPLDSIRKSLFGFGSRKKDLANDQVNPPRPGSSRRSSSRMSQSSEKTTDTNLIPFAAPITKTKTVKEPVVPEFNDEEQCQYTLKYNNHQHN